jgi:hypothetical protein
MAAIKRWWDRNEWVVWLAIIVGLALIPIVSAQGI